MFALTMVPAGVAAQTSPTNYVIGSQDVLTITSYDQPELSGKFTVEADGTFTYPMIGRFKAGGLTLRQVESGLKKQLVDEGYFRNPQVTVSIETFKSQKVFVVGEVRQPGTYTLSGDMSLVEVLARAGSTLPSSSGEAVIVRADGNGDSPRLPTDGDGTNITRIDLKELQNGAFSQNALLRDGDTIFIPRADSIYVFGQVKSPGAYALQQRNTTVLQALALAGGVTDRGSTGRIRITRVVNGKTEDVRVSLTDLVKPGDTITVQERFF